MSRIANGILGNLRLEITRRKVQTDDPHAVVRALLMITALLIFGMFSFSLSDTLLLALAAFWLIDAAREVIGPLYTGYINRRLDTNVRAIVLSMSGQVDAIGQIVGGPIVGIIGNLLSVRAALFVSSMILTPALPLFTSVAHKEGTLNPTIGKQS